VDYLTVFKEKDIDSNSLYSHDDIGVARLFYDIHRDFVRYVVEAKAWYVFGGQRWQKDEGGLRIMELCKAFVQAYAAHAESLCGNDSEDTGGKEFIKYAAKLKNRRRREGILSDAKSIEPVSLSVFDANAFLFNCTNGTLNLRSFTLQPHCAGDFITKLSRVKYDSKAKCPRWDRFVDEIMCGDKDTAQFLQKALGYTLTGDTSLECFFIFYGSTTRNGKSTLTETVAHLMGDYAMTIHPQSLSRRPSSGAAASPDMARLKGARLVNMPEPQKDLELNIALVKQLTGGDTFTGRAFDVRRNGARGLEVIGLTLTLDPQPQENREAA
jgi:putative DNA primase/helicase